MDTTILRATQHQRGESFLIYLFWEFYLENELLQALIDIGALTVAAGTCGVLFYQVNKVAGYIFIPYMAWLGFASLLNYHSYKLNKNDKKE